MIETETSGNYQTGSRQMNWTAVTLQTTGIYQAALLSMAVLLVSCTHLHDPSDAALSKDLAEVFADAAVRDDSLFSAMLENQEAMETREEMRLAMLARESADAFTARLHTRSWQAVLTELAGKKRQLQAQQNNIAIREAEIRTRLQQLPEAGKLGADAYRKAVRLLARSARAQNLWFARREFFRRSIGIVADIAVARVERSGFDVRRAFERAREEILQTRIAVVDDRGRTGREKATIASILQRDEQQYPAVSEVRAAEIFSPEAPPGIKIIVLGLAADLAASEWQRTRLESGYLQALLDIIAPGRDGEIDRLEERIDRIDEAAIILQERIASRQIAKIDKLLTTLNGLRGRAASKTLLRDLLKAIGSYALVMTGADKPLQLRLAMLDHCYSIQLSAINARQHEALIGRGLQGLSAYHQGGLKPETVANFLRAAQAIGLGVIGAGVL